MKMRNLIAMAIALLLVGCLGGAPAFACVYTSCDCVMVADDGDMATQPVIVAATGGGYKILAERSFYDKSETIAPQMEKGMTLAALESLDRWRDDSGTMTQTSTMTLNGDSRQFHRTGGVSGSPRGPSIEV